MSKLVVSENVTLDGVIEDPIGDEGFSLGGWFARMSDRDRAAWADVEFQEAMRAEALLLGHHTHDWFIRRGWPTRTGEWADRMRALPKFVVSSARADVDWDNSTVLQGDTAVAVAQLKQQVSGEIVVYGSGQLVSTLVEHGLVDELRLMTFPWLLGGGRRLFHGPGSCGPLRLADSLKVGDNLVLLTYQTVREG